MFKEFSMVFILIIVHEMGHFLAAYHFKWNLDKIAVYPFGGCVKFDEKINRPMKEEFMILISGPLMQMLFFIFIFVIFQEGLITFRNYCLFKNYHYTLLFFNLLPIYPLDGGRLLNLFLNCFFPFKKGNIFAISISIIFIVLALFFYRNLNFTLMGILLFSELIIYFKRQNYIYNKMLLERYINSFSFNKFKIIKNKNSMYKDKRHIILYNDKYITEKEYLNKRFKVRQ